MNHAHHPSVRTGTPVQNRSRQRVSDILDAARRVVAREGSSALTVTTIAAEAKLKPGSIYRYFADRSAIMQVLGEQTSHQMSDILRTTIASGREGGLSDADILEMAVERLYANWRNDPVAREIWLSILTEHSLRDIVLSDTQEKLALIADLLEQASDSARGSEGRTDRKLLLEFLHCATMVALDLPAMQGKRAIDEAKTWVKPMLSQMK